eukprot:325508_1
MEAVEELLFVFSDESQFTQYMNDQTITPFIDDIGRKLSSLDVSNRYELINSLYYDPKSGGYSSLLHLCFKYMSNHSSLQYTLWRAIYIFCELGLNPMNATYIPLHPIKLRHSMRDSLNSLRQIQEENEMKDIHNQILTLRSQESNRSSRSNRSFIPNRSHSSTPSSCEYTVVGDVNELFADKDTLVMSEPTPKSNAVNPRLSPLDPKLTSQPRSWIDLQLQHNNKTTKRNIITILSYSKQYSPPIFTIYMHAASCCTLLGNAFVSLPQLDPFTLQFAICKLPASKVLSIVDDISYYDHLKMHEYEIEMTASRDTLTRSIHSVYKRNPCQRFGNYLCYLYLISRFYHKFRNDSYRRFIKRVYEPVAVKFNDMILNTIQMYAYEDMSYCDANDIGEAMDNEWLCVWFDSLNDCNLYSDEWMQWISKYVLKRLSHTQKEYLSAYLSTRRREFIKNCSNYRLKANMLDILAKKLKHDNDIASYVNPKWFLNNVVLKDTLLVQKLLIYCLNSSNYKDLCVTVLWSLLTNASFYVQSKFFDDILGIIKKFSNNNVYFVNGCCQNVLDSIFSIRQTFLEQKVYSQKNITTFLVNIASKHRNGELSVDINKGLLQCVVSMPGNLILLKILTSNAGIVDLNECVECGVVGTIQSQIQYIPNMAIRHTFYSWCQYHPQTNSDSNHSIANSNSTVSLPAVDDEQCVVM